MDPFLLGLSLVVILSIFARLAAVWLRVPAIVPLLVVGVLAGTSVTGLIDPQELLGDALNPTVEIAVGIILFEGALGLRRGELAAGVRPAVVRLVTFGVAITWMLATCAVALLFDVPMPVAVLIGAVLIVTGPTVVLPLLEFIAPPDRVRSVLKWEGVLIDPIGAIIAVVVFGSLVHEGGRTAFDGIEIILSLGAGLLIGVLGALLLMPLLKSRRLSGRDKVAATLMMIVASFAAANALFDDSGLLATLVMGVVLANQKSAKIENISEFKETLVPILVGILFVLLAANVDLSQVADLGWQGLALVGVLILVVRPLAAATTLGLPFRGNERALIAGIAPRGIVAASTASVFGLKLVDKGVEGAELIIPITFLVIAGTVFVYSILGPAFAQLIGLKGKRLPTLLLIGGPAWALALGKASSEAGAEVRIWTEDADEARATVESGLIPLGGPIDPNFGGAGSALRDISAIALVTGDDTLNQVLASHFSEDFEADQVFRLRSPSDSMPIIRSAATPLFEDEDGVPRLERRLAAGDRLVTFEPGEQLPPAATPIASMTPLKGAYPPTIRLASSRPEDLIEAKSRIIALVPA
ncbi:MAG: sodium:proton antiporter [Thermoleophilia bacterium]|nr:sodium:proton antiporter [Thermoleophilia bacterium]